jgi:hypothetical protein
MPKSLPSSDTPVRIRTTTLTVVFNAMIPPLLSLILFLSALSSGNHLELALLAGLLLAAVSTVSARRLLAMAVVDHHQLRAVNTLGSRTVRADEVVGVDLRFRGSVQTRVREAYVSLRGGEGFWLEGIVAPLKRPRPADLSAVETVRQVLRLDRGLPEAKVATLLGKYPLGDSARLRPAAEMGVRVVGLSVEEAEAYVRGHGYEFSTTAVSPGPTRIAFVERPSGNEINALVTPAGTVGGVLLR